MRDVNGTLDGLREELADVEASLRDYLPSSDLTLPERESLAQILGHMGAGATLLTLLLNDADDAAVA